MIAPAPASVEPPPLVAHVDADLDLTPTEENADEIDFDAPAGGEYRLPDRALLKAVAARDGRQRRRERADRRSS